MMSESLKLLLISSTALLCSVSASTVEQPFHFGGYPTKVVNISNENTSALTIGNPATTAQLSIPKNLQPDYAVAVNFIESYLANPSASSTYTTANFKAELARIIARAQETGFLESNPVIDAQDAPTSGYFVANTNGNYVLIRSNHSPTIDIMMKLAKQDNQWLVDGSGIVNIPESMRASR